MPYSNHNLGPLKVTQSAREVKQLDSLLECQGLDALSPLERSKTRFVFIVSSAHLHQGSVAANLHHHRQPCLGIVAQSALTHLVFKPQGRHITDAGMEALVEVGDLLVPHYIALGHLIELILDFGSEVIVHNGGEILHQEVIDHHTHVGGDEFTLLGAIQFALLACGDFTALESDDLIVTLLPLILTLLDIIAVLDSGNDWGISRRSANTQFLQTAHQRGLGIAIGLLGIALGCCHNHRIEPVATVHDRQGVQLGGSSHLVVRLVDGIVGTLEVHFQETVKLHNLALGNEELIAARDGDVHCRFLQLGIGHL